jgi:hypothetical protein
LEKGILKSYGSNSQSHRIAAFSNKALVDIREPGLFGYGLVDEKNIQIKIKDTPRSISQLKNFIKSPFIQKYTLTNHELKYVVFNKFEYPDYSELDENFDNTTRIYDNGYEKVLSIDSYQGKG